MSKGVRHQWPDDDAMRQIGADENWNVSAVARRLGIPEPTVTKYLTRKGLIDEFRAGGPTVEVGLPGEPVAEVEVLRQRVKDLEKVVKSARQDDVREERVIVSISEHLAAKAPRYTPAAIPKRSAGKAHSLVLLWSDLHAAEIVTSEETNGANEYNWQTMLQRHDELRRGVLSFAERYAPVSELVVLGLGDMLSGNIHDELAETNEMPLAEATVQLGLDGAEWLEGFVEHFPKVRFAGVVGNHPRPHRKPRAKQKYDNADWTTYQIMRHRLSRTSIEFEVPKAQKHPVMVCGKRILATHGDGIRSTMVDVPWGGIIRLTNKLRNQYSQLGMPIDHFALGHYHEANVVKNRRILMNGSVKGVDEYSMEAFGGGEPPTQLLATFHPKWGLVGAHYIDLGARQVEQVAA